MYLWLQPLQQHVHHSVHYVYLQEKNGFRYRWHFFESWASYFQTKKGYMTQSTMVLELKEVVAPYGKTTRDLLKTNAKCVIIADGCSAHSSIEIDNFLTDIGNIELINIPQLFDRYWKY